MPRKVKAEAERTRARILASALTLFVKKGYEKTTFTDIAARLKMTKGAVYWHFESKEALLIALVVEMQDEFRRQTDALKPEQGLTFLAVAEMMVGHAERIVRDSKHSAFFLLMQTQVRWGADSMAKTREQLLADSASGPYHSLLKALENDIAAGRVRADVDPVAAASICMAIWTGFIHTQIEKFLQCDMAATMRKAYAAVWRSIAVEGKAI